MSITSARKFFEKSGCGTVFIILAGVAMIVTMIFTAGGRDSSDEVRERNSPPIATVGEYKVSEDAVETSFRGMADQQRQQEAGLSADDTASLYASMISAHVGSALIVDLGQSNGLSVSEDQLFEIGKADIEKQYAQMTTVLENMGQIKPGATKEQIQKAYKDMTGRDMEQERNAQLDMLRNLLRTQAGRLDQTSRYFAQKLKEKFEKDIKVNDEELRKSFLTYSTKRIVFGRADEVEPKEAMATARQVLSDIRSGKITFEEAMNRYSKDPAPAPDKPKSESKTDLKQSIIDYDAALTSIPSLKPGEVSEILMTSAGPGIFKLLSVKSEIPSNFESDKENLRKTEVQQRADRKLRDEILKLRDSDRIQWNSKGAQALFLWNLTQNDIRFITDSAKKKETLQKALDLAKSAGDDPANDPKWATLASFAIHKSLLESATAEEKEQLQAGYTESLLAMTDIMESVELRLDLTRQYLAQKDKAAAEQLVLAAQSNNTTGPVSQDYYGQIAGLRDKLKAAGLLDEAGAKQVDDELKRWRQEASQELAYRAEGFLDYGPESITQHDELMKEFKKFEAKGWMQPESKKQFDDGLAKWKQGAFEALKAESEDIKEHTAAAQSIWTELNERIKQYEKIGALNAAQSAELKKSQDKWKTGAFAALKAESEGNKDYTAAGQATWSQLNGRIEELVKLGVLTKDQQVELQKIQAKWTEAKKAADAKAQAEANKPNPAPSGTTGTTGGPFGPGAGTTGGLTGGGTGR